MRGSHRWIPLTKASDAELWCFPNLICAWINGSVNNRETGDLGRNRAHYDVTVMEQWKFTLSANCNVEDHIWATQRSSSMGIFQIREITGSCAGNAENVFPATAGQRSRHASRHVRHARVVMHVGIANWWFPLKSDRGKRLQSFPAHAQPAILRIL